MILDSSAIVAIVFDEPEREAFLSKIADAAVVGVGAPTLVESSIVVESRIGERAGLAMRGFVERAALVVVAFDLAHWEAAVQAWRRFGRGRHPAALNFGDCLAYATAKLADRPFLCKGGAFAQTDLALA